MMYASNRRLWDERVAVHLAPDGYDLTALRAGSGMLTRLEEGELREAIGPLAGKRIIHLQCHFGADTLALAQRGAEVVGVDFSPAAIATARDLAGELGLVDRVRFVECNVYDAPEAVGGASGSFDCVFASWGTISWLPDIAAWARVVAHFLPPGGRLYLADAHPTALVFDDLVAGADGMPGWFAPYFARTSIIFEEESDYANPAAELENTRQYVWLHPTGDLLAALADAGLALRFLREHDGLPWAMFRCLVQSPDGLFRWPDRPWLPLSFSLLAEKPDA
jgi:SAM-dependent methyltransferase